MANSNGTAEAAKMPPTEQSVPGQAPQADEEGAAGQQPESQYHGLHITRKTKC